MPNRRSGVIVRLVRDPSYGFISTTAGEYWLFYAGDTAGTPFERLSEGQVVTFEVTHDAQGQRAIDVQVT